MPARFKLDENLPRDAQALLRKAGHDVHTALDERPHTQSVDNTLALLKAALLLLETEPTQGRLWIIEPERVRIRE